VLMVLHPTVILHVFLLGKVKLALAPHPNDSPAFTSASHHALEQRNA